MKALVIDTAATCIYIAAKNDINTVTLRLNIGMKQAEKLLPAIDYVMAQAELKADELNYMALTTGPGSFTGLRLGMSALKAINLAHNVPVYGIQTLDAYAHFCSDSINPVISVIDAKKDRFYGAIYSHGNRICEPFDEEPEDIRRHLNVEDSFFVTGPDAELFCSIMSELLPATSFICDKNRNVTTDALFEIAEEMINKNEPPLQDYDGPFYIRKSEAEEKLAK